MTPLLARALIAKGAIRQDTVFQAYYNTAGLSGQSSSRVLGSLVLERAVGIPTGVGFDVRVENKQVRLRIHAEDVLAVDGMDLKRMAATMNLYEDGTEMPEKKRRGRRPKWVVAQMKATALAAEQERLASEGQDAAHAWEEDDEDGTTSERHSESLAV